MKKGTIGILIYAIAQTLLLIASKQGLVQSWVAILPLCIVIAVFIVCLFVSVVLTVKQVEEKMKNERTKNT
jgi:cell division protein FtsX